MKLKPGKTTFRFFNSRYISRDVVNDGYRLGGTAVYSTITAMRQGLEVGLVTSHNEYFSIEPLEGI